MAGDPKSTYGFLLDTYETEILKITGIWAAFPEGAMEFRPSPKSRTVIEQMEHQVQAESRWMSTMLGIDTGDPHPAERTKRGFIEKHRREAARFSGRSRTIGAAARQISHHRGQLIVSLRVLGVPVRSIGGPTADTGGKVLYAL